MCFFTKKLISILGAMTVELPRLMIAKCLRKIDLIYACVQDLVFHYWANRDLRVAFSTQPESQASS